MKAFLALFASVLSAGGLFAAVPDDIAALKKAPDRATWERLADAGPDALLPILKAWPVDDPVAANWLRTAFDRIAARHADSLPADDLFAFATDAKGYGPARRRAMAVVERVRPAAAEKWLSAALNDPEFGPDAVDRAVAAAEKLPVADALVALRATFTACTDYDQAQALAKKLTTAGDKPDVWAHLGVVGRWHLVGPFPVSPEDGLTKSFPPETKVELAAEYEGKAGKLKWQAAAAEEGKVDLSKAGVKVEDGAVVYAVARVRVPSAIRGELRVAAVDNVTVWVNGAKVVERSNDYRSLYRTDRYRSPIDLPAGESTVLVKLTKTRPDAGQQEAAARGGRPGGLSTRWDFQARLLSTTGRGLTFTQTEEKK
jgi:hypothetical protein